MPSAARGEGASVIISLAPKNAVPRLHLGAKTKLAASVAGRWPCMLGTGDCSGLPLDS